MLFMLLVNSVFAAGELVESQNATESQSAMVKKYKNLANDYQIKANYYKDAARFYESGESYSSWLETKKFNSWTGSQFGIGGGNTTGNSPSSNFSGNFVLNYKSSKGTQGWNSNSIGQYDYLNTAANGLEKNRLYLQQNNSYMFNKTSGMFAQASYLNDVNGSYTYILNENIGYQLKVFDSDAMSLLLNSGPGLQQSETADNSATNILPQYLNQITYNLNITNIFTFYEQLQNIASSQNNATYSISQINFLINGGFSIGVNYQIIYNTVPQANKAALTTISSFQVNYAIN